MSNWADDAGVWDWAKSTGLTMPDGSALPAELFAGKALAAVLMIEEITGWVPLEYATQTRTYDPPGRALSPYGLSAGGGTVLKLDGPLASVSSLTIAGTPYTESTDFWLLKSRYDHPSYGVRFRMPIWGDPQSISIEGEWGLMDEADPFFVDAQLKLATSLALTSIRENLAANAPIEWHDADVSERRAVELLEKIGDGYRADAMNMVSLRKRVTVGF